MKAVSQSDCHYYNPTVTYWLCFSGAAYSTVRTATQTNNSLMITTSSHDTFSHNLQMATTEITAYCEIWFDLLKANW